MDQIAVSLGMAVAVRIWDLEGRTVALVQSAVDKPADLHPVSIWFHLFRIVAYSALPVFDLVLVLKEQLKPRRDAFFQRKPYSTETLCFKSPWRNGPKPLRIGLQSHLVKQRKSVRVPGHCTRGLESLEEKIEDLLEQDWKALSSWTNTEELLPSGAKLYF